jgi:multidrug efflux pump
MMRTIIDAAFARDRTVLLFLAFFLVAGAYAYIAIPKESFPDITIPIFYVSMNHEGISPEDAERLLVRPMEKELQTIEGLKEISATASEGYANLTLEFDAGFDNKQALDDVREKVDIARVELPADTDEPRVMEVNVALMPVISVSLSGPVPERTLVQLARGLQDEIEALPGVLEVEIGGDREELMEIVIDPVILETYDINFEDIFSIVRRNNMLVAAGAVDTGVGRMVLKVPGVVENLEDMIRMPVKIVGDTVVTLGDIAVVRSTYKDPEGYARLAGQPALILEVTKRVGANIIETNQAVRDLVSERSKSWPENIRIDFMQDESKQIRTMLDDLQNNIASGIILVMIIVLAALGLRSSLLVGLAIPGSFLASIVILKLMGVTLNIVVLFSLILVVGMLVDGAVIVAELAERKIAEGMEPKAAFKHGADRMSWPVISSTATTLAVFVPLLFWPGLIGEFMKYLPITVLVCLTAATIMSLFCIPVLGGMLVRRKKIIQGDANDEVDVHADPNGPMTRAYTRVLAFLLHRPQMTLVAAMLMMAVSFICFDLFGRGVEFFPEMEPDFAQIQIHARGDLSVAEKDALLRGVETRILGMREIRSMYSRTTSGGGQNQAEDVIGVIQVEFIDWQERRKAAEILDEIRRSTAGIPGIVVEIREQENGPTEGKPIEIQVSSADPTKIAPAVEQLRALMTRLGGFVDVEDDRPLPGIEWRVTVNREEAARYGADITLLGSAVRMITYGVKLAEYRPETTDEEVDIVARFPFGDRNLDQLGQLQIRTNRGMVPISNFVKLEPAHKTGTIRRVDARRVHTIRGDVAEGLLVDDKLNELREALPVAGLDPSVAVYFGGEAADQKEAEDFLSGAFMIALFLMVVILVTQFNSIYQTLLVLSAVIFSTGGLIIGLLITNEPFGIVMCGIGVIALAGIVVNNNIVLIDAYNEMIRNGHGAVEAALRTGALRMRPVLLTAMTTVLGLVPMACALTIDILKREISLGAPSTQMWVQLSTSIAGGLTFATMMTLLVTPVMLVVGDKYGARIRAYWRQRGKPRAVAESAAPAG